jgi:hypothetical protein
MSGSSFQRIKYRDDVVVPSLGDKVADGGLSPMKKTQKIKANQSDTDAYDYLNKTATMYPGYTQNTRTEIIVYSEELKFRKEAQPNFMDRIVAQEKWVKQQLEESKANNNRSLMKKKLANEAEFGGVQAMAKLGVESAQDVFQKGMEDDTDGTNGVDGEQSAEDQATLDKLMGHKLARLRQSDRYHAKGELEVYRVDFDAMHR